MYSLGIDVGSSSVKVALLDIESGKCVCSSTNPKSEAPIKAVRKGWAEQDPESWWKYMGDGIREMAAAGYDMAQVRSVGISYQMHGLVATRTSILCATPSSGATPAPSPSAPRRCRPSVTSAA